CGDRRESDSVAARHEHFFRSGARMATGQTIPGARTRRIPFGAVDRSGLPLDLGSCRRRESHRTAGHKYDSVWYQQIAEYGCDHGAPAQSTLAFFPLYPMLIRVLAAISPGGFVGAALVIAWISGLAAAWGMYVLGTYLHDRRTGIALALL